MTTPTLRAKKVGGGEGMTHPDPPGATPMHPPLAQNVCFVLWFQAEQRMKNETTNVENECSEMDWPER